VTDKNNQVTTYSYDNVGNRKTVAYPNGNTTSYDYDNLNRLTKVSTTDSSNTVIASYDYVLKITGQKYRTLTIIHSKICFSLISKIQKLVYQRNHIKMAKEEKLRIPAEHEHPF